MNNASLAGDLATTLNPEMPPIGIVFVREAPADVPMFRDDVPSSCALWRRAEAGVFFAPADRHFNCTVGAMVMGFDLPAGIRELLHSTVGSMLQCGYIAPDEPAAIPSIRTPGAGIVYGPLKDLPVPPDVILTWLTPRQAMLWSEASGSAAWNRDAGGRTIRMLGRPGCAALPAAIDGAQPTLSFGCAGLRTFTDAGDHLLLGVVPAAAAEEFATALRRVARANETMLSAYREAKFASGGRAS